MTGLPQDPRIRAMRGAAVRVRCEDAYEWAVERGRPFTRSSLEIGRRLTRGKADTAIRNLLDAGMIEEVGTSPHGETEYSAVV